MMIVFIVIANFHKGRKALGAVHDIMAVLQGRDSEEDRTNKQHQQQQCHHSH